jgi:hypothetical protein
MACAELRNRLETCKRVCIGLQHVLCCVHLHMLHAFVFAPAPGVWRALLIISTSCCTRLQVCQTPARCLCNVMLCITTAVVELSCGLGCSVVCSSAAHSLSLHFHCIWHLVGCFTTRLDAEAERCGYRRALIDYVGFGMCWHVARVRVRKHRTNCALLLCHISTLYKPSRDHPNNPKDFNLKLMNVAGRAVPAC